MLFSDFKTSEYFCAPTFRGAILILEPVLTSENKMEWNGTFHSWQNHSLEFWVPLITHPYVQVHVYQGKVGNYEGPGIRDILRKLDKLEPIMAEQWAWWHGGSVQTNHA